ncbi:DUF488 family protein [Amycolatopsis sp. FDAARGOS 1241]|nr:DUF488 family protein [Amycolatopsis sp. FDAARGOS 1241]
MLSFQVRVARVYEPAGPADGTRVLVDRLWPRGVRKGALEFSEWCKEVAPSPELRTWYGHAPERFDEFAARYRVELEAPARAAVVARLKSIARAGNLTLLTASKDVSISQAAVLARVVGGDGGG